MTEGKQIYYHRIRENIKNMSPLLKELAVRSGATPDGGTVICSSMDPSKFAELIITECLDAVDKTNRHHAYTSFDVNVVETTIAKSKQAITEHFK